MPTINRLIPPVVSTFRETWSGDEHWPRFGLTDLYTDNHTPVSHVDKKIRAIFGCRSYRSRQSRGAVCCKSKRKQTKTTQMVQHRLPNDHCSPEISPSKAVQKPQYRANERRNLMMWTHCVMSRGQPDSSKRQEQVETITYQ